MNTDAPITPDSLGPDDTPAPGYGFDPVMDAKQAERLIAAAAAEAATARLAAEVADRRAAQSAREAREAQEAAAGARIIATRAAIVAAVSLLVAAGALVSTWRPTTSNVVCDVLKAKTIIVTDGSSSSSVELVANEKGAFVKVFSGDPKITPFASVAATKQEANFCAEVSSYPPEPTRVTVGLVDLLNNSSVSAPFAQIVVEQDGRTNRIGPAH